MEHWYEIWADLSGSPPYLLLIECGGGKFRILDPGQKGKQLFESSDYDEISNWLLEDEYERVSIRIDRHL